MACAICFCPALFDWDKAFYKKDAREGGVSNGPIQFESAHKFWPLLELLAKIT